MLKQLLEHIVKCLVDKPEMVIIKETHNGQKTIVEIYVAAQDLKRVIGKEGRIVRSIRSLVNCLDIPGDKEVILDIAE